jgi:hypothetical protein
MDDHDRLVEQKEEQDQKTRLLRLKDLDTQAQNYVASAVALTHERKLVQKEVHEATVQKLKRTEALLQKALLKTMQVCLSL